MTHTHALPLANSTPKPNVLLGFTGLLPLLLSVPILLLQLWGPGIVISIVTTAAVVVYHVRRGQGLTSLDALSILFSVTNAILYLGFKNPVLVQHLDLIIYNVLLAQILYSFRTSEPWTAQFARRSVSPELWSTPGFLRANRVTTLLWGACFLGLRRTRPGAAPQQSSARVRPNCSGYRDCGDDTPNRQGIGAPIRGWLTMSGAV